MSVLQLNLQLSNMECIQMNLKLCFISLFSVICTLLAKMAKKFQIIMSAYVNIIQTQSEELRLQAALKAQLLTCFLHFKLCVMPTTGDIANGVIS